MIIFVSQAPKAFPAWQGENNTISGYKSPAWQGENNTISGYNNPAWQGENGRHLDILLFHDVKKERKNEVAQLLLLSVLFHSQLNFIYLHSLSLLPIVDQVVSAVESVSLVTRHVPGEPPQSGVEAVITNTRVEAVMEAVITSTTLSPRDSKYIFL